jgi:hypothetical protein
MSKVRLEIPTVFRYRTPVVTPARLVAVGATVLILGGVACSVASPSLLTRAASQPTDKVSPPTQAPAAAPPLASSGGGLAAVAPAAASSDAAPRVAAAPAATGSDSSASTADSVSPSVLEQSAAQPLDRMVIRTAQLSVEVNNMEQALAAARAIAQRDGGFVSASNTHLEKVDDQDRMVADLTLQVRTDAADSALSDLRGLGNVTSETSGSQDVTEEYVDLDSNLRNLQASESAILKLMDKATRIEDVLALQRELTNVRGQIERIQGRKRFLERRTDMATITLSLRPPAAEAARPAGSGAWDPIGIALRAWQASLAVLRGVAEVAILAAVFSWWLIPLVAGGLYWWLRRRRPANGTATPAAS